jgi:hypothetical protein
MVTSKFGSLACAVRNGATKEYGFHREAQSMQVHRPTFITRVEVIVGAAAT